MTTTMLPRVPGPRSMVPGRLFFALRRDPIGFLGRLAAEYGDVAGIDVGRQAIVLLMNPEHIRDVLVVEHRKFAKGRGLERAKLLLGNGLLTSEGDLHRRQRRLMQPAFHRERIAGYAETMVAYARREYERWRDGDTLDIHDAMMRVTLAIAGKTLLDADVEGEARELGDALTTSFELFDFAMLPFTEYIERLPIPTVVRFRRARARLDATIHRIIAERRASGAESSDLLSMLLQAQDTEGDGAGMSDEQLRDEALTIFLAGHETTANALTWSWYLLSQHPEVAARLEREVDAVLGSRAAIAADVPRLEYARQVLAESMRLYPPAWIIARRALEPVEIAGYTLSARTIVLLCEYLVHRDPRWWPTPHVFDPGRWLPEAGVSRPKFAYFPFGGGPRQCIGEAFAWMEGVLLLATFAQRWRLRLVPDHPVGLKPLITLRPAHGMRMTVHARPDGAA